MYKQDIQLLEDYLPKDEEILANNKFTKLFDEEIRKVVQKKDFH